ncbi:MAG: peptide chain release factor N(5)-glutamine methyltransferase [Thermoguttaceae bacterium]|jgi:release factor glutamine methyltransferase
MSSSAPWTVGRLLQWTAEYLKSHGSESPRLDAEVLLANALGCRRIELYTAFDNEPGEEVRAAFRELVRRRAEGAPVAYLVGHREFYSLDFRVTPDVLIPRPETELLVIALLDLAKTRPLGAKLIIADAGTGSGIIAVCAAKHLPGCRVTAIDISPAALEVAKSNAEKHGILGRIEFVQSDLFAGVAAEKKFDFILSNPPYIAAGELSALAPDVKNFEPRAALLAGPRGTEVIESLIPQSAERLHPGGYLIVEISPMIHDRVLALLAADERFEPATTIKDLARLPRVLQARRK